MIAIGLGLEGAPRPCTERRALRLVVAACAKRLLVAVADRQEMRHVGVLRSRALDIRARPAIVGAVAEELAFAAGRREPRPP